MATTVLKIGIVGCGPASVGLAERLIAIEGVSITGCVDADRASADALAARLSLPGSPIPVFGDHAELIRVATPDALALFSPHQSHYRPAMDGLQAGCHLLIASALSISVQESVDIVNLARGRDRKISVGHHYRLLPSLIRARQLIQGGEIGRLRLILGSSTAAPMPKNQAGDGSLAGSGIRLIDALLWCSGRSAEMVSALRSDEAGPRGGVTSASIKLENGVLASVAISGLGPASSFSIEFLGESGRLKATDQTLCRIDEAGTAVEESLSEPVDDIASDFVGSILSGLASCCAASEAIDAVRVLEAIARSAAIGQFVGLT